MKAAGCWLVLTSLLLLVDGVYIHHREQKEADRNVRIIKESRHRLFKHRGRVMTRTETMELLKREPLRQALPQLILSAVMILLTFFSFRRPFLSVVAGVGALWATIPLAVALGHRLGTERILLYIFVFLVLLLGVKASHAYERRPVCESTEAAL